ncbi:non-hydrolyzing UDP-N-acetylglucosamine 2-epimerase [Streptomyces sp. AK02-04a]|uniref:non-hydrolyzing UDP-N-acetylglucosamine 2-epimerase n=1 Tax=Streptomyces sp. AK02-04a TaxID=3028649 RepID=UPI0029AC56ED|nr:UDP-N-acetylglucosamine 2-epimerase (non-hydrolyzing) [Streptomyces sp. AK02-04a]MDX3763428.1 UDP-N-acetylglucosamine 2-epimerase (non-hydrolyzing) [Streptomyces sp. AK02-04a]
MNEENDVAVVLGTRPEIIKLAGVIRNLGPRASILYTGQHRDDELFESFFRTFKLPQPQLLLTGISGSHRSVQISRATYQLADHFRRTRPRVVVVQGDTNSTLAGAQAANYCGIPVLHVEAGLRSNDRTMPEEINRRLVSVLADVHCAATPWNAANLVSEGIPLYAVRVTGNTIVEATCESLPGAEESQEVLRKYDLHEDEYILATIHRPENTDDPDRLAEILDALAEAPIPVVLPVHPRTAGSARTFGLSDQLSRVRSVPPLDYSTFLALASRARLLISDSGGIQEECTILKKPLVVVRRNTERPEAIAAGFAVRVSHRREISEEIDHILAKSELTRALINRPCPFGDGKASERITEIALAMAEGAPLPPSDRFNEFSYSIEPHGGQGGAAGRALLRSPVQ